MPLLCNGGYNGFAHTVVEPLNFPECPDLVSYSIMSPGECLDRWDTPNWVTVNDVVFVNAEY